LDSTRDRTVQCNTTYIPPSYCTNCPIFPILLCRHRAQPAYSRELLVVAPRRGSMLLNAYLLWTWRSLFTVQILGMLGYGTTAVTGKPLCGNGHCVCRVDVVWGAYDQLPHVPVAPTLARREHLFTYRTT